MRTITSLRADPALAAARGRLTSVDEQTLDLQARLSAIPAPTGSETRRGEAVSAAMRRVGLANVSSDAVGNVTGWHGDARLGGPVVVAAHLDTVFGPDIDVTVRRAGARLSGPGIADNARGLAGMLALAETAAGWTPRRPIAFVATVGEEGAGDLRGMRHLLNGGLDEPAAVIVLDGAGDDRVVHGALGTRRFRAIYRGPGGHSWAAFGVANPAHAAGTLARSVAGLPRAKNHRTACSVVGLSGGRGLNCIPEEARVEVDLRSEDGLALAFLERELRERAQAALQEENARRTSGTPPLSLVFEIIGNRPAGHTDEDHPLVVAAVEATRAIGRQATLASASTDANIPISLGIPAVALGAGGRAGEPHRTTEWFENVDGPGGLYRALLVLAAAAEVG